MKRVVLALVAGLVATGCASTAGEQVASRIRAANSPVVREVVWRPANFLDPPEVDVWLIPGATESQAEILWCQVIVPAGGSPYQNDTGVAVWNDAGTEMMVTVTPVCPTPSP